MQRFPDADTGVELWKTIWTGPRLYCASASPSGSQAEGAFSDESIDQ
jgi:hypothetical protein